ncbi:MAG: hypothetical protein F6K39_11805 [Okeania sp. SIO3B3]|nr:hypothetical protein [Okeania sp. SIO3B3]
MQCREHIFVSYGKYKLYHVRLNTYTLAEGRQRAEGSYAEGREQSFK